MHYKHGDGIWAHPKGGTSGNFAVFTFKSLYWQYRHIGNQHIGKNPIWARPLLMSSPTPFPIPLANLREN